MGEIQWKFEGGRIQNGELFKFYVGWLFRLLSPEQQRRLQHSFLSAMCCVDWVNHEYHTQPLLPSPKKNASPWAVNSASFPTEVRLMAMISISPLAILALETVSFALLGQLCYFACTSPSASDHTRIWSEGQYSQCKFSRFVMKCQKKRGRVVWGRAVYFWPTEHTFHAHWSESTAFKQSRE